MCLELDTRGEPFPDRSIDQDRAQPATSGQTNKRFTCHGRQGRLPGHGVVWGHGKNQFLVHQRLGKIFCGKIRMDWAEDDVDISCVQPCEEFGNEPRAQRDGDFWVAVVELCQEWGKIERPEYRSCGEAEVTPQDFRERVNVGVHAVELAKHGAGADQDECSGLGQDDTSRGPIEQSDTELVLKAFDLCGDRRLGNAEVIRSPPKATQSRNCFKVDELTQLHAFIMNRYQ